MSQRRWWVITGICAAGALSVFTIWWILAGRGQPTVQYRSLRAEYIGSVLSGVSAYRVVFGHYPRSTCRDRWGRPLLSWRLATRAWMEQISEVPEERLDLPWYAPENLRFLYTSYSRTYVFAEGRLAATETIRPNVAAIVGPETAFGDQTSTRTTIPGDTIVLVETSELDIFWTAPGDLDVRDMSPSMVNGIDGQGVHIAFADGQVWYMDRGVPFDVLKRFFTIEEASPRNREKELSPYRKG